MVTDYTLNRYASELAETLATLKPLELRVLEVAFGFFDIDSTTTSKDGNRVLRVNQSLLAQILAAEKPGVNRNQAVTVYRSAVEKLKASGFLELYTEICEAISYQE